MGLIAFASIFAKAFALLNGAWCTFKVLKGDIAGKYDATAGERMLRYWAVLSGLQTYEGYLEIFFFWLPFYSEVKLGALVWLAMPGSSGPAWLFDRVLHPAMAIAAFHLQRDVIPRVAAAALQFACKLQNMTLPPLAGAVRREELKMWDRSVRGQLASVQMELERRRLDGQNLADQRLPDNAASALLIDADVSRAQLLRELLEPASTASANGGICGAYKRGENSAVAQAARDGTEQKSGVRFAAAREVEQQEAEQLLSTPPRNMDEDTDDEDDENGDFRKMRTPALPGQAGGGDAALGGVGDVQLNKDRLSNVSIRRRTMRSSMRSDAEEDIPVQEEGGKADAAESEVS